jgi:uncharacterized protein YyaL (SSP411 family)
MGMPGFRDVLEQIQKAWSDRRDAVQGAADEITDAVVRMGEPVGESSPLSEDLLRGALRSLLRSADRTFGGFGGAPKFPHPMDIRLLLRLAKRFGNDEALDIARQTLDKMAAGGIYDHLGGGFHRYSTDARWLVPHFEKMLYDNAQLASAYIEAYQFTGNEEYATVVRETLDYVLREMTQPGGGFYSTQDADSEGVEGKFFVWSAEEVVEALGASDARVFMACYDVTPDGNWEGHNILNRAETWSRMAEMLAVTEGELRTVLARCRQKLFAARAKRIAPGRDDKILVSWNGLMISALAQAAAVLGEPKGNAGQAASLRTEAGLRRAQSSRSFGYGQRYAQAAVEAADFILNSMRADDGRLLHAYKDGRARFNAYLDDYACLIDGLTELYQATFEARFLDSALELAERMIAQFGDEAEGGFFFTSSDHESLIARTKDSQDNATPSGNGMAATALFRLGLLCGRTDLEAQGARTLERLSGQLARIPMAGGQSLIALDFLLGPSEEIVIVDGSRPEDADAAIALVRRAFRPRTLVSRRSAAMNDETMPTALAPLLRGKVACDGQVTAYVCQRGACHEPLVGFESIEAALRTNDS